MKKIDVLLIGTLPPPIGGVSIHLYRLKYYLGKSFLKFNFYDYKKDTLSSGWRKILKSSIIHSNFSNKSVRILVSIILKLLGKKNVVTFHGMYTFNNILDLLVLRYSSQSIVLNEFTYLNAVKKIGEERIRLIPAFIPPLEHEETLAIKLAMEIDDFVKEKKIIACSNAHNYVLDKEGKDLYGIGFLLKAFKKIPDSCLIISDPSGNLIKHYGDYRKFNNVLFISQEHSFFEILKRSNVFIRATTSDGDSLSVKEALYLNVKVIASDCVDRPKGCIIYRTGDELSLIESIHTDKKEAVKIQNGAMQLIDLYGEILGVSKVIN